MKKDWFEEWEVDPWFDTRIGSAWAVVMLVSFFGAIAWSFLLGGP